MSMNIKNFISYDRYELDKNGRKMYIYRKTQNYLTKSEVLKARQVKEQMRLNVT